MEARAPRKRKQETGGEGGGFQKVKRIWGGGYEHRTGGGEGAVLRPLTQKEGKKKSGGGKRGKKVKRKKHRPGGKLPTKKRGGHWGVTKKGTTHKKGESRGGAKRTRGTGGR